MKKKLIVIAVILIAVLLIFLFSTHIEEKREEQTIQTIRPADSVEHIIVSPRCDTGTITVYATDEGRVFQYRGKIEIKNSGWNGKEIEIIAREGGYAEDKTE